MVETCCEGCMAVRGPLDCTEYMDMREPGPAIVGTKMDRQTRWEWSLLSAGLRCSGGVQGVLGLSRLGWIAVDTSGSGSR